ncbi:LIM and senescent cell antigen-like-containing domain protein 1 isoform X4, partial [Tachysurus ichikawai]
LCLISFLKQLLVFLSCLYPLFPSHRSLARTLHCPHRDKFVEVDLKPVCKHCYDRLPEELKRRLAKRERDTRERKKKIVAVCP